MTIERREEDMDCSDRDRQDALMLEICADIEALMVDGLADTQNRWAALTILSRARDMAVAGRLDMAEQRRMSARALMPEVFNDD